MSCTKPSDELRHGRGRGNYGSLTGHYVDEMGHYGGVTREKVVSN